MGVKDSSKVYVPVLAAPATVADVRYWVQVELQKIHLATQAITNAADEHEVWATNHECEAINTFAEVGYGGVTQVGGVALNDIDTTPQVLPTDETAVAAPVHVVQDLVNDGIAVDRAGVWLLCISFAIDHNIDASTARRMVVDLFDTTNNVVLRQAPVTVGRNAEGTNFSTTVLVSVAESVVDQIVVTRIHSDTHTFSSVALVGYSLDITLVDYAQAYQPCPAPVVCLPENAYDDYIRNTITPILWFQGKDGMVNAGSGGALTVTTVQNGYVDYQDNTRNFNVVMTACETPTGAGAMIDGNGGSVVRELISHDQTDWTLSAVPPEPVHTLSWGGVGYTINISNIQLGQNFQSDFEQQVIGVTGHSYDHQAQIISASPVGALVVATTFINFPTWSVPQQLKDAGLPSTLVSGTDIGGTGLDVRLRSEVVNGGSDPSSTDTGTLGLQGHGGSRWHWAERQFVISSDYSIGIVTTFDAARFGLTSTRQVIFVSQGAANTGIEVWFEPTGEIRVRHNATTTSLGIHTGDLVITFEQAAETLRLYEAGLLVETEVLAGTPTGAFILEGIGRVSTQASGQFPLIAPFFQHWYVDKELTDIEVLGLYNANPLA